MARFHFHLWDGNSLIADFEGSELADIKAVRCRSIVIARELLAEEVKQGRLPLCMRLDVQDSEQHTVHRLDFKDAIQVVH